MTLVLRTEEEILAEQAEPRYVWEGLIPENSLCALVGPSGTGKSFLAQGLAKAVSLGKPYLGRDTTQCTVLVIAAEGRAGIPRRLAALKEQYGASAGSALRLVMGPVAFHTPDGVREVIEACKAEGLHLGLIIVDTWAANAPPGFEENSAAHFTEVLEGLRRLQGEYGATILVIHHTGWNEARERGTSAFRAAQDVLLQIQRAGQNVARVKTVKARDWGSDESFVVKLVQKGSSCIMELAEPEDVPASSRLRLLTELNASPKALTASEWLDRSGLQRTQFYNVKAELLKDELVEKNDKGRWVPTPAGEMLLANPDSSPAGVRSQSGRTGFDGSDSPVRSRGSVKTPDRTTGRNGKPALEGLDEVMREERAALQGGL